MPQINIDKSILFDELAAKLNYLKAQDRGNESILFGINNFSVFKNGDIEKGGSLLRILEEQDWKRELAIYCSSGIVVKAIELFKGEITSVVYFQQLGEEPYELRYYALEWENNVSNMAPENEQDPRASVLPKVMSNYDHPEPVMYIYAELRPLHTKDWLSCCVCGIQRKESIICDWNKSLAFCSLACQSIAWAQRTHDEKTSQGGDRQEEDEAGYVHVKSQSDDVNALKAGMQAMELH